MATSSTIRVIVAEDHPMMREAIETRLRAIDDVEVVGVVDNGRDLVALFGELRPDVVLTDFAMPEMSGAQAIEAIRAIDPDARVIVLSAMDDQTTLAAAIHAGAAGFLLKTIAADELARGVHMAALGEPVFDAATTKLVMAELRNPSRPATSTSRTVLSPRETEILALIAEGLTNAQIGESLFISPQTVKTHLERIFTKLGVRGRAAAVREGLSRGLLS